MTNLEIEQFDDDVVWPRWFRVTIVSISTLILCSCSHFVGTQDSDQNVVSSAQPIVRAQGPCPDGDCEPGHAGRRRLRRHAGPPPQFPAMMPPPAIQPWPPLGAERPWPRSEYLLDGGDRELPAKARADWTIDGLDQEDTVVHYDTVDGRILTEPSNRVAIYAPRFRSVRRVITPSNSEYTLRARGHHRQVDPLPADRLTEVRGSKQNIEAGGEIGLTQPSTGLARNLGVELARTRSVSEYNNGYLPGEASTFIRLGRMEGGEMPHLAKGNIAAETWTTDTGVQVAIDQQWATVDTQVVELGSVHIDETAPKKPKMRIVKLASTSNARVGEFVEFTLRFDNVGDERVGNVTIVDNLTTRLEYVPESQTCTLKSEFAPEVNEGDSLILRWEITEPIEPGEGGVIRFRCKVR
ncbi:MAG: DUF11 domain-containing protein [Pirellulales bacterium]|nr:DUF11 domain-containing protein [Pirellulales bacterium]